MLAVSGHDIRRDPLYTRKARLAMKASSFAARSRGGDGLAYGRDADHAGTSDRHRRGDHTDRHHAQRIEVNAPVSLLQKLHQR